MASTFDYLGMQAIAIELLAEFGMDAVLRREGSPSDRPCRVAVIDYRPRDRETSLVNMIERSVLFAPSPALLAMPPDNEQDVLVTFVQPATNPPIMYETIRFSEPAKLYSPAGIVLLFEAVVRR